MRRLTSVIDTISCRALPADTSAEQRRRARVVGAYLLLLPIAGVLQGTASLLLGQWLVGLAVLAGVVLAAGGVVVLTRRGAPILGGHLACLAAVVMVWPGSLIEGGVDSTVAMWLLLPVIGAGQMLGSRGVLIWSGVVVSLLLLTAGLDLGLGWMPPVDDRTREALFLENGIAILLVVLAVALLASSLHTSLVQDLERAVAEREVAIAEAEQARADADAALQHAERERTEAQEANAQKSAFLATLSHEVRSPLHGVLGTVQLLDDTDLDEDQRALVRIVRNSGEGLLNLVNDVLDLSKMEAGALELDLRPADLRGLIEDVAALFGSIAARKGVDLIVDVDPQLPHRVEADEARVRQVVTNLVGNALKFTERGYVRIGVEVEVELEGRLDLRVTVEDSGIGIAQEALPRLFEAFQQAERTTSANYGGTGLGLAICDRLVVAMGGSIEVDSTVGRGTSFSFPLSVGVHEPDLMPSLMAGRALLLCGLPVARQVLCRALVAEGMAVEVATEVPEDLTAYDVVLIDDDPGQTPRPALYGGSTLVLRLLWGPLTSSRRAALAEAGERLMRKPFRRAMLRKALGGRGSFETSSAGEGLVTPLEVRVLVVDDHPVNRMITTRLLQQVGLDAVAAADGIEALEALRMERFDLVLLDCEMPGMDGYEVSRRIRGGFAGDAVRRVPVVALTASLRSEVEARCHDAGMDDVLSKPVHRMELTACIERWTREGRKAG